MGTELLHRELTGAILDAAIEVHREPGPGLLESTYEACVGLLMNFNVTRFLDGFKRFVVQAVYLRVLRGK